MDAAMNESVAPLAHESCSDDFAELVERPAPRQLTTAGELATRFQRIHERRRKVWRPCAGWCGTPVAEPVVVCDACAGWAALDAQLQRMRRAVGACT